MRYFTPIDFQMAIMPVTDRLLRLLVILIYDTGIEMPVLLGLTYGDIRNASGGLLRVPISRDEQITARIPDGAAEALQEFVGAHSDDQYLFSTEIGKRWSVKYADKAILSICRGISPDALAYSYCRNAGVYAEPVRGKQAREIAHQMWKDRITPKAG